MYRPVEVLDFRRDKIGGSGEGRGEGRTDQVVGRPVRVTEVTEMDGRLSRTCKNIEISKTSS